MLRFCGHIIVFPERVHLHEFQQVKIAEREIIPLGFLVLLEHLVKI